MANMGSKGSEGSEIEIQTPMGCYGKYMGSKGSEGSEIEL